MHTPPPTALLWDAVAGVVLGVVGSNGVAEMILAILLVPAIGKILVQLKRRGA